MAKATYVPASVEDASFWRILMPSFPAYLLLTASVVLLVPGVQRVRHRSRFTLTGRRATIALAAAVAVFAVLPLGVIAATPVLKDGGRQVVIFDDNLLPVSSDVGLQANSCERRRAPVVARAEARATDVFFRVLRAKSSTDASLRRNTGSRPVPALHGVGRGNEGRLATTISPAREPGRTASACRRTGSTTRASATSTC
mgnify:CR=1 FL=1